MADIVKLKERQFPEFATLQMNAYPVMGYSERDRDKLVSRFETRARDPRVSYWGMFEVERMVAGMRLHDFMVNFRGQLIESGGVGGVAVDLAHKKKRLAKQLMQFFLNHYRDRGMSLAVLWPFRPDFYRKMGFGYGSKIHRYTIKPADLPDSELRHRVRFLNENDIEAMTDCYNRFAFERNGMIEENEHVITFQLDLDGPSRVVGFEENGEMTGYMTFVFANQEKTNFLSYDVRIGYLIYNTRDAFAALMAFLRSQSDQVRHVILDTAEPSLEYFLHDPRDHSDVLIPSVYHQSQTAGVGVMYRVIDLPMFFDQITRPVFGEEDITIELRIADTFMPSNPESIIVTFAGGEPNVTAGEKPDVTVSMDMSDFSSMVMGAVSLRELYRFGRAEISKDKLLGTVNGVFATPEGTSCMTAF